MVNWEDVDVPQGSFIGWGTTPGQFVEGRVQAYDERGGNDYNGDPCPLLDIELSEPAASFNKKGERYDHQAGDFVSVTAGQTDLKKAVRAAFPERDDLIRIEMPAVDDLPNGNTIKRFKVRIARGAGKKANSAPVGAKASSMDEEPPF